MPSNTLQVTITNNVNGWSAAPKDSAAGANIKNQGKVTFKVPAEGCRLCFGASNIWAEESTNCFDLSADTTLTLTANADNQTLSYGVCAKGDANCSAASPKQTTGYSIKTSS
jgi:hypothetical protein